MQIVLAKPHIKFLLMVNLTEFVILGGLGHFIVFQLFYAHTAAFTTLTPPLF